MALKVKAIEKKIKFSKTDPGVWRYVMSPELYTPLSQAKVIKEAALRSGVSRGVMKACWDAAGEVIKAWATEGHSVALPGLGSMRFGLRSKAVENVNDVKTSLISSRRIIFTPSVDLKDEPAKWRKTRASPPTPLPMARGVITRAAATEATPVAVRRTRRWLRPRLVVTPRSPSLRR